MNDKTPNPLAVWRGVLKADVDYFDAETTAQIQAAIADVAELVEAASAGTVMIGTKGDGLWFGAEKAARFRAALAKFGEG